MSTTPSQITMITPPATLSSMNTLTDIVLGTSLISTVSETLLTDPELVQLSFTPQVISLSTIAHSVLNSVDLSDLVILPSSTTLTVIDYMFESVDDKLSLLNIIITPTASLVIVSESKVVPSMQSNVDHGSTLDSTDANIFLTLFKSISVSQSDDNRPTAVTFLSEQRYSLFSSLYIDTSIIDAFDYSLITSEIIDNEITSLFDESLQSDPTAVSYTIWLTSIFDYSSHISSSVLFASNTEVAFDYLSVTPISADSIDADISVTSLESADLFFQSAIINKTMDTNSTLVDYTVTSPSLPQITISSTVRSMIITTPNNIDSSEFVPVTSSINYPSVKDSNLSQSAVLFPSEDSIIQVSSSPDAYAYSVHEVLMSLLSSSITGNLFTSISHMLVTSLSLSSSKIDIVLTSNEIMSTMVCIIISDVQPEQESNTIKSNTEFSTDYSLPTDSSSVMISLISPISSTGSVTGSSLLSIRGIGSEYMAESQLFISPTMVTSASLNKVITSSIVHIKPSKINRLGILSHFTTTISKPFIDSGSVVVDSHTTLVQLYTERTFSIGMYVLVCLLVS